MARSSSVFVFCLVSFVLVQSVNCRFSVFRQEINGVPGVQGQSLVIVNDGETSSQDFSGSLPSFGPVLASSPVEDFLNPLDWITQQLTILQALHSNVEEQAPTDALSAVVKTDFRAMLKHVKCARMQQALAREPALRTFVEDLPTTTTLLPTTTQFVPMDDGSVDGLPTITNTGPSFTRVQPDGTIASDGSSVGDLDTLMTAMDSMLNAEGGSDLAFRGNVDPGELAVHVNNMLADADILLPVPSDVGGVSRAGDDGPWAIPRRGHFNGPHNYPHTITGDEPQRPQPSETFDDAVVDTGLIDYANTPSLYFPSIPRSMINDNTNNDNDYTGPPPPITPMFLLLAVGAAMVVCMAARRVRAASSGRSDGDSSGDLLTAPLLAAGPQSMETVWVEKIQRAADFVDAEGGGKGDEVDLLKAVM